MTAPGTAVAVQTPGAMVPMTFPQKVAYARELSESNLLPKQFQKNPASVLWAIEYGEALGLRGVIAMSGIHVIENKPAPSAAMAAGLIRARGHRLRVYLTPPTEEHQWGTAVAELTRRDDPDFTFRSEWSVEDAIRAEICKLSGDGTLLQWSSRLSKWVTGNWQKFHRQMLKARVLGEVCRDGGTDVLIGLHYLAEEMEGVELDRNGEIVSAEPIPASWTPEPAAQSVGEHTTTPPDVVDTAADPTGGLLTDETRVRMNRLLRAAGLDGKTVEGRARRLRLAEILLGLPGQPRTLTSSEELTEDDGLIIVDALTGYRANNVLVETVEGLLREDDEERARDVAEPTEDTPEEESHE